MVLPYAVDFVQGSDLDRRLARIGKRLLGCGDAALVLGSAMDPWVVKVGFDGADGWPAWARWCQAHPSPHVPCIYALHVLEHEGRPETFVAIVERLRKSTFGEGWLRHDRKLKRDPLRLAGTIAGDHPPIAAMLLRAASAFPGASWDMAPSNWMERQDGTVVLNDPLSRADVVPAARPHTA